MNHPAKMNDYGDPAGKEVTIASQKKLLASDASPEFKAAIAKEKPIKMSEDLSNPVLSDDMNLTGQGYAQDEGGNTSIMPALRNLYGMRK